MTRRCTRMQKNFYERLVTSRYTSGRYARYRPASLPRAQAFAAHSAHLEQLTRSAGMRPTVQLLTLLVATCGLATGCGLNTAVLQTGGNGRMGVLLNYSCNAQVCD